MKKEKNKWRIVYIRKEEIKQEKPEEDSWIFLHSLNVHFGFDEFWVSFYKYAHFRRVSMVSLVQLRVLLCDLILDSLFLSMLSSVQLRVLLCDVRSNAAMLLHVLGCFIAGSHLYAITWWSECVGNHLMDRMYRKIRNSTNIIVSTILSFF